MTRLFYPFAVIGLLLFFSCALFLISCDGKKDKNPCSGVNCPASILAPILPFDIRDKQTGQDWFFSDTPRYPISALHITRNSANTVSSSTNAASSGVSVDLLNSPSCFRTYLGGPGNDTLYIQIANLAPDTLSCYVEAIPISCCFSNYRISNVVFDRQLLTPLLDSAVLILKK